MNDESTQVERAMEDSGRELRYTVKEEVRLAPVYWVASVFALSGMIVCVFVGVLLWFISSFSGWGDGTSGNAISSQWAIIILLTLPFVVYFGAGWVAALSRQRRLRVVLAWVAHLSLLYISGIALWILIRQAPLGFIVYIGVIILFSKCWMIILRFESTTVIK